MKNTYSNISISVLSLPRFAKQIIAISSDISICIISLWIALFLRLEKFVILEGPILKAAIISVAIAIPVFYLSGLYRTIFRYSGKSTIVSILIAHILFALIYFSFIAIYRIEGVPRSIGILQPIVLFFLISSSRLSVRFLLTGNFFNMISNKNISQTLVYGAGTAGREIVSALDNSGKMMEVVGFLDDNKNLQGQIILGKSIYSPDDIKNLISTKNITNIILAIPSMSRSQRNKIINNLRNLNVAVNTLPSVTDLAQGKFNISDIKSFEIEDLLGREQVEPQLSLLNKNINTKTVLVTGAGGSIGSELCRQIIKLNPKKIILFELSEYSLYEINSELLDIKKKRKNYNVNIEIIPLLGSVQAQSSIEEILRIFRPDTIYHAAAYKHLHLVEENIIEGVKNNIFGTILTVQAAIKYNVANFVFVSSDKAVRPESIMGATKLFGEICLKSIFHNEKEKKIKVSMVRFGNVLGSSGSIIPKFKKQLSNGGPITLTHPNVSRYFMTIAEASQLVIQAGAMSDGCQVFVLDMGEPIKIIDIIDNMIRLSGLKKIDEKNKDGDIKIEITGLRTGEKLFEELLIGNNPKPTQHKKILKIKESYIDWNELSLEIKKLELLVNQNNVLEIINLLKQLMPDFKPNKEIVDHMNNEKRNFH